MQVELQVALTFLVSFLYNKLPRRRVNQFAEELAKALRIKFRGHWYPEKPFKGSAFRCIKTAPPLDPVFQVAARESGVDLRDVRDHLPADLSIWIDPGEVSYRLGERGPARLLFSEQEAASLNLTSFCPETFRPAQPQQQVQQQQQLSSLLPQQQAQPDHLSAQLGGLGISEGRLGQPLTFTTAAFAQTKFGSTKLKSNSRRRMSPTEFSNYIRQRALAQQLQGETGDEAADGRRLQLGTPPAPHLLVAN